MFSGLGLMGSGFWFRGRGFFGCRVWGFRVYLGFRGLDLSFGFGFTIAGFGLCYGVLVRF